LSFEDLVSQNGYRGKYLFQRVESIIAGVVELLRNLSLDKTGQQNNNVQVFKDKSAVKICKT